MIQLAILFIAKVIDNILGTAKTLFIQRNQALLASISLFVSNIIYYSITKEIVSSDSNTALFVVCLASSIGCYIAIEFSNKFSKEKTYINVIMSDDIDEMKKLRDFLAKNKIDNMATDSYTLDWDRKTLSITAYAETKKQSMLIDEYLESRDTKFKRIVQGKRYKRHGKNK